MRYLRALSGEGHASVGFSDVSRPSPTATLFYREKCSTHTDLGIEISWMQQEFGTEIYSGGLAGGTWTYSRIELHTLDLAILPQVRLGVGSEAVFRFGVSGGVRIAGTKSGYTTRSFLGQNNATAFSGVKPVEFGGELRAIVGFGFRIPTSGRGSITLDPYAAHGLLSMLREDPGSVSSEFGLRLGWSFRMRERTLTQWLDRSLPVPPTH